MTEAGSSTEPPNKKVRLSGHKVDILFEAPTKKSSMISVYPFWLSSFEFFEAKLERWTSNDAGPSQPIVLELPAELSPQKGAKFFKKRLTAIEIDEECHWDVVKCWRAADGDEEALFSALFIFDLVLMRGYSKEVSETLLEFRVDCPSSIEVIAKIHGCTLRCADSVVLAAEASGSFRDVELCSLGQMFTGLFQGIDSMKPILERCIAALVQDKEEQGSILLAWISLALPEQSEHRRWAEGHLKQMLVRRPALAQTYVKECKRLLSSRPIKAIIFASLSADVLLTLCVESSRTDLSLERDKDVVDAIAEIAKMASPGWDGTLPESLQGVSLMFMNRICKPGFEVASKPAQAALLKAFGANTGKFLVGEVHRVHPGLRHALLPYVKEFSITDLEYLGNAPFP